MSPHCAVYVETVRRETSPEESYIYNLEIEKVDFFDLMAGLKIDTV